MARPVFADRPQKAQNLGKTRVENRIASGCDSGLARKLVAEAIIGWPGLLLLKSNYTTPHHHFAKQRDNGGNNDADIYRQ